MKGLTSPEPEELALFHGASGSTRGEPAEGSLNRSKNTNREPLRTPSLLVGAIGLAFGSEQRLVCQPTHQTKIK
jgi:hypothetical protein